MHSVFLLFSFIFAAVFPVSAYLNPYHTAPSYRSKPNTKPCYSRRTKSWRSQLLSKPYENEEKDFSDSIVTGVFVGTSLCGSSAVFWSEWEVFQTGCGPLYLPDWLERSCYLDVFVVSGLSIFLQIVFRQGLSSWAPKSSRQAVQVCEVMAWLAVLGAVFVLVNQLLNGEAMDGLSGIDMEKCRAKQAFLMQFI